MPKLKTRKSIVKKIRITGRGKLKTRATGQNHYNSRKSGKQIRGKRTDQDVFKTVEDSIKKALPYLH